MIAKYNNTDVEMWLKRAKDDVLWAKSSLKNHFYSQSCFISQQVAEKALKSLCFSLQERFTPQEIKNLRTHSLNNLIDFINKKGLTIPNQIKKYSEKLNDFYLPTRYPDVFDPVGSYTERIANDALEKAEKIVEFVGENLKSRN